MSNQPFDVSSTPSPISQPLDATQGERKMASVPPPTPAPTPTPLPAAFPHWAARKPRTCALDDAFGGDK